MINELIGSHVFALAPMIRMNRYFYFFPLRFGICVTWTKKKLGIIEHLTWPVNGWTLRKRFQELVGDNQGPCRVLNMPIAIVTLRAVMIKLRLSFLNSL